MGTCAADPEDRALLQAALDAVSPAAAASTAHLEDGTPVSPGTARRMSCDA